MNSFPSPKTNTTDPRALTAPPFSWRVASKHLSRSWDGNPVGFHLWDRLGLQGKLKPKAEVMIPWAFFIKERCQSVFFYKKIWGEVSPTYGLIFWLRNAWLFWFNSPKRKFQNGRGFKGVLCKFCQVRLTGQIFQSFSLDFSACCWNWASRQLFKIKCPNKLATTHQNMTGIVSVQYLQYDIYILQYTIFVCICLGISRFCWPA